MATRPLHASTTAGVFRLFAALLVLGLGPAIANASAAESVADNRVADNPFATVLRLRGEVKASSQGIERPLREGDRVYPGDKVAAAGSAEAVLKTADAGMVAVRPGAQFVVQDYAARGNAKDSMVLRLLTGSLRLISGWLGGSSRANVKVHTPTATIGIRGTDHEPFVLVADQPAQGGKEAHKAGTYDKVNRGGTTLSAGDQNLDIEPGRVGFARELPRSVRTRALMTLLLPVLLEKVPDFYVPGEFDAELDRYSAVADEVAQRDLQRLRDAPPASAEPAATNPVSPPLPATPASAPRPPLPAALHPDARCAPQAIGKAWLAVLDDGITRRDAATILGQFADDVAIKAIVRNKDGGLAEVTFTRDEMVRSTLATVAQLQGYSHRRFATETKLARGVPAAGCERLAVKSTVIEQGSLAGKPFRFESVENFILERRDGLWLAIRAESTQR